MIKYWNSDNRATSLYVTIKCSSKKRFYLVVSEKDKPNSNYAKREMEVHGERTVYFSFPLTTKVMTIGIFNMSDKSDNDFTVELKEAPLKTYNIWTDQDTKDFLKLNFLFSQVAGFESASKDGKVFSSGQFTIKYYPVIIDYMTNRPLSTPARIGHNTGTIEVAKNKFDRYTFAERVIIMLHEFSHKYRNPKLGLAIENEKGADVNALYIYLGMGFSKIDAINVFANVFLKAQTSSNIDRMRNIMNFIQKFEQGEFAQIA